MRIQTIFLVLFFSFALSADNPEKTQKKELETQVKKMTGEAQKLEKAGQLAEARIKYAESQALILKTPPQRWTRP
jgi:ABC-type enterochelin transport system substrate-binding protein